MRGIVGSAQRFQRPIDCTIQPRDRVVQPVAFSRDAAERIHVPFDSRDAFVYILGKLHITGTEERSLIQTQAVRVVRDVSTASTTKKAPFMEALTLVRVPLRAW